MSSSSSRTRTGGAGDGRAGFGLSALVAIVGVTTAALWGVTGVLDQVQAPAEFVRSDVPGVVSVVLTQVGRHVVYFEGPDAAAVSATQVDVVDPDGEPVTVRRYSGELRYDVPGRPGELGTAVGMFEASRTGSYRIGAEAASTAPHGRLAVGDDLAPSTVRAVALPSLAALASIVAAGALAASTWTRRRRRSQR